MNDFAQRENARLGALSFLADRLLAMRGHALSTVSNDLSTYPLKRDIIVNPDSWNALVLDGITLTSPRVWRSDDPKCQPLQRYILDDPANKGSFEMYFQN